VLQQPPPSRFAVCPSEALGERAHLKVNIRFEGRDEECLVVRFVGQVYAYINRCVHMPRRLDCEAPQVFDESGRHLRCSMHGIVYTPETGTSVSALCAGDQLRSVAVYEDGGVVGLADHRVGAIIA